ncbi:hypothetical protein NSP_14480 [Nodularia spumigena CCY9414]|nr:hypothetical protein NSP_14480 [Nodularia spumigena CCY9414]
MQHFFDCGEPVLTEEVTIHKSTKKSCCQILPVFLKPQKQI